MTYKAFCAHSVADKSWVEWIAWNAASIGVEVYLYEDDRQPGVRIADKIGQEIQSSDAVIVFLSAKSQLSTYVQNEVGFAKASGKVIIPIILPGADPRNLGMLEGAEYLCLTDAYPNPSLVAFLNYLQRLKTAKQERAFLLTLGTVVVMGLLARSFPKPLPGVERTRTSVSLR